jgi:diamine N-acetyltransferase
MNLEKIRPDQAQELSDLCRTIYQEVYPYLWYDNGFWYMETRYNAHKLLAEITDPDVAYYFIKIQNKAVGHLKLNLNPEADTTQNQAYGDSSTAMYKPLTGKGLELERIYLLAETAGKGVGLQVMKKVFEIAHTEHYDYVWLHAMDSAPARGFYEKYGFEICGETTLPFENMKPEFRRMFKMWKKV